jgi:RsiW-degrading membrane proteinase PrsW (M82 family)
MSEGEAWAVSLVAAVVPTIVYVLVLWWLDRYEKEPRRLLWTAFLWGAVPAVILSVIGESVLGEPLAALSERGAELVSSAMLAPLIEELTKGLAVFLLFLLFHKEFDDVLDGIIYGATVGFGFAMTENVFYFMSSFHQGGLESLSGLVLMRGVVFGLNHALFTATFGATLGYARISQRTFRRWVAPPVGLLGAMLLHGIHNLFTSLADTMCFGLLISIASDWGGVLVILAVILLSARREKQWIVTYLRPEVDSGLITQQDYEMISSYRHRQAALWRARLRLNRGEARRVDRLTQLATDLAFKVRQGDVKVAEKLRQQIAGLSGGKGSNLPGGPEQPAA